MSHRRNTITFVLALLFVAALVTVLVAFLGEDESWNLRKSHAPREGSAPEARAVPQRAPSGDSPEEGASATDELGAHAETAEEDLPALEERPGPSVRGQVLGPDGEPIWSPTLLVFRVMEGRPVGRALREAIGGREGFYALRVEDLDPGDYQVIAHKSGLRPASRPLRVAQGLDLDGFDLHLERGFELQGCVQSFGVPHQVGIEVGLDPKSESLRGSSPEFVWKEGRVELRSVHTATGMDGRFRIRGLAPFEHELDVRLREGSDLIPDSLRKRCVQVPDPALIVRLDLVQLDLEVRSPRGKVAVAEVKFVDLESGRSSKMIAVDGKKTITLLPDHDYRLEAKARGHERTLVDFRTPSNAPRCRREVELEALPDRSIRLNLTGFEGPPPRALWAHLRAVDIGGGFAKVPDQPLERRLKPVAPGASVFLWERIDSGPGAYELSARPEWSKADLFSHRGDLWLPVTVVVPEAGEVAIDLPLRKAAGLSVSWPAEPRGGMQGIGWRLLGRDGTVLSHGQSPSSHGIFTGHFNSLSESEGPRPLIVDCGKFPPGVAIFVLERGEEELGRITVEGLADERSGVRISIDDEGRPRLEACEGRPGVTISGGGTPGPAPKSRE